MTDTRSGGSEPNRRSALQRMAKRRLFDAAYPELDGDLTMTDCTVIAKWLLHRGWWHVVRNWWKLRWYQ